ncbi:MAG: tetratricopeptide repeat protein, partial [Candidatus Thorarchaeota archaeon]
MVNYWKGIHFERINEFDDALKHLKESFEAIEKYDTFSMLRPNILSTLGITYTRKGELDLALKFHKESLASSKGKNLIIDLINGTSYHNIGEIYFQKGDIDSAVKYYEKSLKNWQHYVSAVTIFWV